MDKFECSARVGCIVKFHRGSMNFCHWHAQRPRLMNHNWVVNGRNLARMREGARAGVAVDESRKYDGKERAMGARKGGGIKG